MIRLRRSEVLWIVRGIRLAKFVRCCARSVRRLIRPTPDGAEAETVEAVEAPLPGARASHLEANRVERELPRRQLESSPACADSRIGVEPHFASPITQPRSSRRVQ